MTGSLHVKRGKWYLIFSYQNEIGEWKQKAECTGLVERGNKKKAKEILEKRLDELNQLSVEVVAQKETYFLDYMENWLDEIMVMEIRPNTLKQYKNTFRNSIARFKPFQKVSLSKLSPAMIQAYIKWMVDKSLSPKTVRKHWSNINKCLTSALHQNLILFNPAQRVTLPKLKRFTGARALGVEELHHLMEVFKDDPLETVVMLTVHYGLRRSEVLGLSWDAVDFEEKKIHVRQTAIKIDGEICYTNETKTEGSRRTMPLTPSMEAYLLEVKERHRSWRELLGEVLREDEPICIKLHSKRGLSGIDPDFCASHFRRVVTAHKLNCRFHDLRHSVVNMLRRGGCDAKQIAGFIGHSDVTTTLSIYSHLLKEEMSEMGKIIDSSLFSRGA